MKNSTAKKLFVLDTSVLLFDHLCMTKFKDHDIIIPITVLEELDKFKVGTETINFEARKVIRFLDSLYEQDSSSANDWVPLGKGLGNVCIGLVTEAPKLDSLKIYGETKDNHIINTAVIAKENNTDSTVILVTKDINLRIKSRSVGVNSQDYLSGKVVDLTPVEGPSTQIYDVDPEIVEELYKKGFCSDITPLGANVSDNSYHILNSGTSSVLVRYSKQKGGLIRIEKQYASNIKPKNSEQTFAMDAVLDEDIKLVALEGVAGTGKTLLALAAALERRNEYNEIILARPVIPLKNQDVGFLPGDAKDKISPYMQPLFDNLKFIKSTYKNSESRKAKKLDSLEEDGILSITALAFIRGRSLSNTYFIIDEAQNLTPHEIKTIITRAGEGTKLVFTGDINQIDTPYMDRKSNGLTFLIDRFRGQHLFGHVKLEKGERSELANLANKLL